MLYLSASQVVVLHDALLAAHGGDEGGGHRGASDEGAEAAVQAVKNSYYESIYELAAAHAVYIMQGHVFLDANKRTGQAAMYAFLHVNGAEAEDVDWRVMVELQERAERGEGADRLVAWIAGLIEPSRLRGDE